MSCKNTLKENIKKALSLALNCSLEQIHDETSMSNTSNWTSLTLTNFIVNLEEILDIDIELDDAENLTSIKNAYNIIQKNYSSSESCTI